MLTLLDRQEPLSDPAKQRELLEQGCGNRRFTATLAEHGLPPLRAKSVEVLQVNLGKLCNQTCRHCHVDAGPTRREIMSDETATACLRLFEHGEIPVLDLTGGAPEMNPQFRRLVSEARRLGRRVIDRSNLTILVAAGFDDLPEFLAGHGVEIVASLPCYLAENTDTQRGRGVFDRSIKALQRLNALGYGEPRSGLVLDLMFNPIGPSLPPAVEKLESTYRNELFKRYGVRFNRLYTLTNMPISRFLDELGRSGRFEEYMQLLIGAFNPATVNGLMCRTTLSVGWDGRLYDCDFNQMLGLGLDHDLPQTVHNLNPDQLANRPIVVGQHCYGCTAGAGSS
ncbi:MAG: arsenosugar biosynthesis radical SAM protein ArsS, partial [Planctomycetaceae bacterium]|nr:arsenosugar biosynthesis radical SAM protein ArsS [Planctomycetaceae bacterium]